MVAWSGVKRGEGCKMPAEIRRNRIVVANSVR